MPWFADQLHELAEELAEFDVSREGVPVTWEIEHLDPTDETGVLLEAHAIGEIEEPLPDEPEERITDMLILQFAGGLLSVGGGMPAPNPYVDASKHTDVRLYRSVEDAIEGARKEYLDVYVPGQYHEIDADRLAKLAEAIEERGTDQTGRLGEWIAEFDPYPTDTVTLRATAYDGSDEWTANRVDWMQVTLYHDLVGRVDPDVVPYVKVHLPAGEADGDGAKIRFETHDEALDYIEETFVGGERE